MILVWSQLHDGILDSTILSGYVARFIFETAKISQLFCHQIIWNMKANCYRDDAGEVVCASHCH